MRCAGRTFDKPFALLAVVVVVVPAALALGPGAGGGPEAPDANTAAAPRAAEPLEPIKGQGSGPDSEGRTLETGLRDVE